MFLFWTHVGAVVLLLGFLMIGLSVGSFDFADVTEAAIPPDIVLLSAVAISIGLGVKLAVFMFHIWLPWVHGAAPTPISALLSPAMIGIGAYGIFRLVAELLPGTFTDLAIWFHVWGLVTMLYGGAMALMQDDIKRLFAYSSISQMGYILFGIGSLSVLGMAGAEMMYITHALGKGLLFMTAGILIVKAGTRSISRLGGLAGKMPITAVCAVIGALTIMGVPPTSGFMGEWILFYGALETAISEGSVLRSVTFGLGLVGHRPHHVVHTLDAQEGLLRQDARALEQRPRGRMAHDRPHDGAGRIHHSAGDIPGHIPGGDNTLHGGGA